jgi:sugar transferase (PEP-CTERM/EpsH1 system associated)
MLVPDAGGSVRSTIALPDPIKIVHVVLALDVGGLERVVLRLLGQLDRSRWAPVVVVLDEPGVLASELTRLGVPLRVMGRGLGLDLDLAVRLAALLRREGACLVHTHNAAAHLYGAIAARLAWLRDGGRGPRVVHTKHGRNDLDQPRRVLVNRLASALSDRIVTVSDDAAAVAVEIERACPDKVTTIGNGVDTGEYRPRPDPAQSCARAALSTPLDGFHVGCVARLAAVKDHGTLLDAFARFRSARPDAHLTLVGDGPERACLEERAARLDLGRAVTFAGARADVARILAAFDVFAISSLSEGLSLTLLEAASAGLAVVATRVGGNAEVVVDGETGLLVPPAHPAALAAALAAVAARADRAAMGAAGRARVERRFSVERMAQAYAELYAEVLGIA